GRIPGRRDEGRPSASDCGGNRGSLLHSGHGGTTSRRPHLLAQDRIGRGRERALGYAGLVPRSPVLALPRMDVPQVSRPRVKTTAAVIALWVCAGAAHAQETYLLIVAGLGGEPTYAESFRTWSSELLAAGEKRLGIPRANITYLTESPEKEPTRVD